MSVATRPVWRGRPGSREQWREVLRQRGDVGLLVLVVCALPLMSHGLPRGIAGLGVVAGCGLALNAIGLVLVYRSTRIVNFAQVALGAVSAAFFYEWVVHVQWMVLLHGVCAGCVPGVPAGTGIGTLQDRPAILDVALTQRAPWLLTVNLVVSGLLAIGLAALAARGVHDLVRRFWSRAPRLIPTVATMAIAAGVGASAAMVTGVDSSNHSIRDWSFLGVRWVGWWPYDDHLGPPGPFDVPQSTRVDLTLDSGAHFHTYDVVALLLTLLVSAGLVLWLRRSRSGTALRGLAENADRARSLGIDVDRMVGRTWLVSGVLSGVAAVLAVIAAGSPTLASTGDTGTLTRIVAIAVYARFASVPVALVVALLIGVIDQGLFWNTGTHAWFDGLIVIVVAASLLLQRTRATRAEQEAAVAWLASPEIRPVPPTLRRLALVHRVRFWGAAVLLVGAFGFPLATDPGQLSIGTGIVVFAILGLSLLVLAGWAGQISVGQMALAAVAAYVCAIVGGRWGVPMPLALLLGALAAAAAAALVGLPALRLRGPFLVVMTLALSVGVSGVLLNRSLLGSPLPDSLPRPLLLGLDLSDDRTYYYVCLTLLALCVVAVSGVRRSRTRRALIACRDNEPAAQSFGIGLVAARLEGFALSGFIAGIGGGLLAYQTAGVNIQSFGATASISVFLMVVIGGVGAIAGPLLGAAYFGIFSFLGTFWSAIGLGVGALLLLQFAPGGIGGIAFRIRDAVLRRLAMRNRLPAPSLGLTASAVAGGQSRAPIRARRVGGGAADLVPMRFRLAGEGPSPVHGVDLAALRGGLIRALPAARPAASTEDAALLQCRRIDVHYDGAQALFKVDLDVRAGQVVALVGTNGAGKTTLLNAISGLHRPSGGAVLLDGHDVTGVASHLIARRGLAVVPGGAGTFPSLTVRENLEAARWNAGDGPETTVEQILAIFPQLSERLDSAAGDLSGGEQQMLAIGQALLARPRLLMIDELSLGLSARVVDAVLERLRALRAAGAGIVVVEQSLSRTLAIADVAVVLEKGEVRYAGAAQQLLDHPELFQAISFGRGGGGAITASEVGRRRFGGDDEREVVLDVEAVSAGYGGVLAVDGVSLQVRAAEVVGIIGPNGAGKTSLFDVVSGFLPVRTGTVRLLGDDVTRLAPAARARLGLMRSFQNARLFPSLTVRDCIATALERRLQSRSAVTAGLWLPPARRDEARVRTRVDQLVELLELGDHAERTMAELPTGLRRIVDIACQLAARPRVLLLDEPSSGLSHLETEGLGPVVARIRKDLDCAVLIVEHDMTLLSALSDRLVAMERGRVIAQGRPAQVLADDAVINAYFGGPAGPGSTTAGAAVPAVSATA